MLEFDMDVPTTLSGKIGLIADKGRIFGMQGELFTEESWLAVMLGQGIIPR
jgi:tryptophan halogenase